MIELPPIRWQVVADFLILAAAFYALLRWAKSARALRIALAVVGLHALALLARNLNLVITSWVLDASAILAILVLLLIFQPELRRAFMRVDSALRRWPRPVVGSRANHAIANAAFELAGNHQGALLVITRRDAIGELVDGGTAIGATVSAELLEAIFQKSSPLHDGAVIIDEGDQLVRANAVLPLTRREDLPGFYGTRHRAAVGLAERCDALVVVVSEERAEVTLMDSGRIQHIKDPEQLVATLEGLLNPAREPFVVHLRRLFLTNLSLKLASLGLAAVIWGMSFLASGTTIRTVSAPVEFGNVPVGMEVAEQSTATLEIQLRGSPWIMDSVSLGALVAHFDLGGRPAGWQTLRFKPDSLDLPPGITVDRVTPAAIRIQLVHAQAFGAK